MKIKAIAGGLALLSAAVIPGVVSAQPDDTRAPLVGTSDANAIDGSYIVVFHKDARTAQTSDAQQVARSAGAKVQFQYSAALEGFAATMSDSAVAKLRSNPAVAYIEANRTVTVVDSQPNATWGLDRIDQRDLPLNQTYNYDATGAGVHAYIVDTGVRQTHQEFAGRIGNGFDAIDGGTPDDCHGHGTHVAGTVGGTTYGVAKQVTIHGVRVLNCQGSGTDAGVIAGVDWVTQNHTGPSVANMSLGGGVSQSLDNAVANSIASGVSYSVAAGNDYGANACNTSPARTPTAITVGATASNDARADFSNIGSCLDIFAPGVNITSAWSSSDTATNTISGTSMATPHTAGVAALYLQANPGATAQQVRDALVGNATPGKVTNPGSGSPNLLLHSLFGGTPPPPPPPPPPTGCSGYEITGTGSLSGSGDYDLQPSSGVFQAAAGQHKGCLDGPSGVDFDLYLYKCTWYCRIVAQGISSGPDEVVTYNGSAGQYIWLIESYSGSGNYGFGLNVP